VYSYSVLKKYDDLILARRKTVVSFRARCLAGVLLLLFCAGCGPDKETIARNQLLRDHATTAHEVKNTTDYMLQKGDDITIKFFLNDELNVSMPIRPDGKISLQLVDDIAAAGLTCKLLCQEISKAYDSILKHAQVTVVVNTFADQNVYIGGEVLNPGLVKFKENISVLQAILIAGGFQKTAEIKNIVIIRNQGTEKPLFMMVDIEQSLKHFNDDNNIMLCAKDIVYVPQSKIAEANQFVSQYIDKLLPFARSLNLNYTYGDQSFTAN